MPTLRLGEAKTVGCTAEEDQLLRRGKRVHTKYMGRVQPLRDTRNT